MNENTFDGGAREEIKLYQFSSFDEALRSLILQWDSFFCVDLSDPVSCCFRDWYLNFSPFFFTSDTSISVSLPFFGVTEMCKLYFVTSKYTFSFLF